MKLVVELEFPTEEAVAAIQALQQLSSSFVVRTNGSLVQEGPMAFGAHLPELSEAEQRAMLAELSAPLPVGAETAEEMIARIYGDRRDAPQWVWPAILPGRLCDRWLLPDGRTPGVQPE